MLLRWIVNNYLREAAEEKVRTVVGESLGQRAPRSVGSPKSGSEAKADATIGQAALACDDQTAPQAEEFLPCDAVFLFALGIESGGLVDALADQETSRHKHGTEHAGVLDKRQVAVVEGGVGASAAAKATQAAIHFYQPRWVISAGFAGALHESLRRGQILMADQIVSPNGQVLETGLKLDPQTVAATKGLHVGRLLTVDHLVRLPEERRRLHEEHQAVACDMETFAVAQACRDAGTRFLSVRIISDAVDDELPPEIEHLLAQKTLVAKIGAATGALLKRFSAAKDLWKLREDALKASDRLARFLRGVMKQLD